MKTVDVNFLNYDDVILNALREDIPWEDVSANAVVPEDAEGEAQLIAKEAGVLAGAKIFARTFALLDLDAQVKFSVGEGETFTKGQIVAEVRGNMRAILSGERTALNFLQRMSGIATYTKRAVALLRDSKTRLVDTRKTTPGLRALEKYAVRVGGAGNHRFNLSDGVLLKDNHIGAAGGVKEAILRAKAYAPFVRKIEIEVETIAQLEEALGAGADIVMLDNMPPETLKKALELAKGRAETEISGNVTAENLPVYASLGADYISSGALTHSAPVVDFSLKNLKPVL